MSALINGTLQLIPVFIFCGLHLGPHKKHTPRMSTALLLLLHKFFSYLYDVLNISLHWLILISLRILMKRRVISSCKLQSVQRPETTIRCLEYGNKSLQELCKGSI